jgi:hypothetical protein
MKKARGNVLLITHKRVNELRKVIDSLDKAWVDDYKTLNIILHVNEEKVIAEIDKIPAGRRNIIQVDRSASVNARSSINLNVHDGLKVSFSDQEIDFVTVLEDDILIRKDFLKFNSLVINQNIENCEFMGINGFSAAEFNGQKDDVYGKFRYGFGWGWTITRSTWNKLLGFWSGNEDAHWDAYVERFLKTGYVVMPHNSRIQNLGFGESATHTIEIPEIAIQMEKSLLEITNPFVNTKLREETFRINWRKDCLIYISGDSLYSRLISKMFNTQYFISKTGRKIPTINPILTKIIGFIDKLARPLTNIYVNSHSRN